ncbi:MAG: adenylate kinase [Sulfurospirillaceae bacterium]|nr:adenylate kinase [Sulfurospirillaceae bacterium]
MKNLFLIIGAPGSGKTTDAEIIAKNNPLNIAHFSTGDLLREEVKSKSALGSKIDKIISAGNIVPALIAAEAIIKAINQSSKSIIIIDGYPRSIEQLEALDDFLSKQREIQLSLVIEVVVSTNVAKKRVLSRSRGADDDEKIFDNRIKVYLEPLSDIENFYKSKDKLFKVDGERSIEAIVKDIESKIHEYV